MPYVCPEQSYAYLLLGLYPERTVCFVIFWIDMLIYCVTCIMCTHIAYVNQGSYSKHGHVYVKGAKYYV